MTGERRATPRSTSAARSRVLRQVVTMEILWFVDPGSDGPDGEEFRDWEAVVREAVFSHDPPAHPGVGSITDVEELTP